MTGWSFNLRSGSYSDSEDDTQSDRTSNPSFILPAATGTGLQNSSNHSLDTASTTQKNDTSRELEDLFGGIEDDAIVDYKPNPWNIAKINANTRASATGRTTSVKPVSKPLNTKPVGNKRLFIPKDKVAGAKFSDFARFSVKVC